MWIIGKKYAQKLPVLLGALNMSKVLVGYNFLFILLLSLICMLQFCQDCQDLSSLFSFYKGLEWPYWSKAINKGNHQSLQSPWQKPYFSVAFSRYKSVSINIFVFFQNKIVESKFEKIIFGNLHRKIPKIFFYWNP